MKYISFIVTTRNDGHGDEELRRIQIFVDTLSEQCIRFNLDVELIIIEWNPPADRPQLAEALKWTQQEASRMLIRIIQVSPEIHSRFENSDSIALFQMMAKNVGIRRAYGRFVLATNIDILFSNELMQLLASEKLDPERMYRISRYDVPSSIPSGPTVDEQLKWCEQNLLRVYRYRDIAEIINGTIPPPPPPIKETFRQKAKNLLFRLEPHLYTNACGDFTLMSAKYWMAAAGYAELPLRAMKIDGLLCYAAHYAGAKEYILKDPMRIYHLEHSARVDGALVALSERQSADQSLQIAPFQFGIWVEKMRRSGRPLIFNDRQWGLAGIELPETIVVEAGE